LVVFMVTVSPSLTAFLVAASVIRPKKAVYFALVSVMSWL
jgi:hypothetical protein